jgi:hypothetical protein
MNQSSRIKSKVILGMNRTGGLKFERKSLGIPIIGFRVTKTTAPLIEAEQEVTTER